MRPRSLVRISSFVVTLAAFASITAFCSAARADDAEDLVWDLSRRARSQLDIAGFSRSRGEAARELGFLAEVGVSWDTPSRAPAREAALRAGGFGIIDGALPAQLAQISLVSLPVTPRVARQAVSAAFRNARLLSEDAIDGLGSRARWSGLVPELRLRAARLWDETARAEVLPSDALRTADSVRANLWLEARASFRLDRLIFADEELAAFRLRLEQSELAQRLALRVVAMLSAWQRAWVETRAAPAGSVAALEASLKMGELEATLDVVTGGWFAAWRGREVR